MSDALADITAHARDEATMHTRGVVLAPYRRQIMHSDVGGNFGCHRGVS
jgi:hypothetical protein